ncbi:MAG: T9SS type A sorting domain-containing protein [Ignavibacteriales bacterium]|nr:T9SS type A sorting domain-containing protein [Ignavibacteriales bacterium]
MLINLYEHWLNGHWVNISRYSFAYNAQGNLFSCWYHTWDGVSWIPTDFPSGRGWGWYSIYDSAGNIYRYQGYNFTLLYKIIVTGVMNEGSNIVATYSLSQNYPNPFNPTTKIQFSIPKSNKVVIKVFDILGTEIETVVNKEKPVGTYELNWNASNLPSGVYFYQLRAGNFVQTRKMILLK